MKQLLVFIPLFFIIHTYAQESSNNTVNKNEYTEFPNSYNRFINDSAISWAGVYDSRYSFVNCGLEKGENIYDYIISSQQKGRIKSYISWYPKTYLSVIRESNDFYKEVDKSVNNKNSLYILDSLKEMSIYQILFIQNHELKAYPVSAGANYIMYTAQGIQLGNTLKSICCVNKSIIIDSLANDKIIPLKTTYQLINADSDYYSKIYSLKKMYGMNLITTLWYDLSKGYNDVLDIKTNTMIPASQIWDYSDTLQQPIFDSLGDSIGYKKIATNPLLYSFSSLGIYQDWYYNITRNIFFCKIKQVDIYAPTAKAEDGYNWINEKRFKIIFK